MNRIHRHGKNRKVEKAHSGCMGKMVNLFELNAGISANRRLTDKSHWDGSPLCRSRSDVFSISPSVDAVEEKVVVSEYKNSFPRRKSNVTPMKTLIAQEMSEDVNSRNDPPNLVAKLMGLDALPGQEPYAARRRRSTIVHSRSHSDDPICYWEKQNGFFHYEDPSECQDCYNTWQQPLKSAHIGRYEGTMNDEKMNLVRQKFVEVKRLSMDEKLCQSKQFQDALDVLSSNKDLFLKCLQEPSSMLHQHIPRKESVPSVIGTQRITVLKPSKVADCYNLTGAGNNDEKQVNDAALRQPKWLEEIHQQSSPPESSKYYENHSQSTQIVVLKPSPGRLHNLKTSCPQPQAGGSLHDEDFFGDVEDDEKKKSRTIAKVIMQQMREKLGRHCMEETLTSSVYSNGFAGDESSFDKLEAGFAGCNHSDSEVMSPVSRHSWDHGNMLSSPYSLSFGRVSYSPESSVCREAKKQLSERWAMMASSGSCPEPRHLRRSSNTLGEMLALSEGKSAACPVEGLSTEEPRYLNSFDIDPRQDENINSSPRNLTNSKSVPVSCAEFGMRLNPGISNLYRGKPVALKEDTKARSGRSLFAWKISSLLFPRNTKRRKHKPVESEPKNEFPSFPGKVCIDGTVSHTDNCSNRASPGPQESLSKASDSNIWGKMDMYLPQASQVAKPISPRNRRINEVYPNPVWVLYQSGDLDEQSVFPHSEPDQNGIEVPCISIGSNLIDKSPPIGSIARTLPRDTACVDKSSIHVAKKASKIQGTDENRSEWLSLVEALLTVSGFDGEMHSNSFLGRWHSPETPLDPLLRDEYINLYDKETLHGTNQRQKRSSQRLVFDCVNAALVEIAGYGGYSGQSVSAYDGANKCFLRGGSSTVVEEVWARINAFFFYSDGCLSDYCGDDNSLVVESMVRKEVAGRWWIDNLRLEMDILGKEIEVSLLEELVHEAVVKLTGIV